MYLLDLGYREQNLYHSLEGDGGGVVNHAPQLDTAILTTNCQLATIMAQGNNAHFHPALSRQLGNLQSISDDSVHRTEQ